MNTNTSLLTTRTRRLGSAVALAICLSTVALLLPGAVVQPAWAEPQAQETPPDRLPYDGIFDLTHLEGLALPQAGASALTAPEYAAWSKLVFQSGRNNHDWEIYGALGDGTNPINLTNNTTTDVHARQSRDATRIVFASNRNDGNHELFVMNSDGSNVSRLTYNSDSDVYPAWSPDDSKIVFQSYRDGQAEIYVMNSNGNDQTRLTNYADYDGEPAWSPDGSQIAFVRRDSGRYRIWVMNADGSNPRQYSDQASSENPVWSPDGNQIAYDADGDGDGWLEIWVMDADGSNQRQVYEPGESNTDAWVRSWSPDGRYIAFTRISFVQRDGNWYWTTAFLDAWDSTMPWTMRLSDTGADWHPDWRSLDLQAPESNIEPLPAESPFEFGVSWSGADVGPSGMVNFDVQVKDGVAGLWADWYMATTNEWASYRGRGGHSYYFRARARDKAGNVEAWPASYDAATTVESSPPVSAIDVLPSHNRGRDILLHWSGFDPGGSGIEYYDLQVQDTGAGVWTDYVTDLGGRTSGYTYTGVPGRTYRFRVRGRDSAKNVEPWPPGNGDAETTIYLWAVSGAVRDNSGIPVENVAITTTPALDSPVTSDEDGVYAAYANTAAARYAVTAGKAGYGSLPATEYGQEKDVRLDVVLPPADNVVRNWGFERAGPQPDWQIGGSIPAEFTATLHHTGGQAAWLSGPGMAFTPPANLSNSPVDDTNLQMIPDGAGGVHFFWHEYIPESSPNTRYAWRGQNAAWIVAPSSIPSPSNGGWGAFAVGPDSTVHVIGWQTREDRYDLIHTTRPSGGTWSIPAVLTAALSDSHPGTIQVEVAADNSVHVVWDDMNSFRIYWTMRSASGAWRNEPLDISGQTIAGTAGRPVLVVDQTGGVHVAWIDGGMLTRYACRPATGSWLPAREIRDGYVGDPPQLAVQADGTAHVAWTGGIYAWGSCQGTWSTPEAVGAGGYPQLAVDQAGAVHMLLFVPGQKVQYVRRPTGGAWSVPQTLDGAPSYTAPSLAVDDSGTAHVLWTGGITGWQPGTIQLYHTRYIGDGVWSAPKNVSGNAQWLARDGDRQALAVEGNGRVHAEWLDGSNGIMDLYYATAVSTHAASESTLSQTITVPAAPAHPVLSFLYRLGGASGASSSSLSATVGVGSTAVTVFAGNEDTGGWTHRWLDLQSWAGQDVVLTFNLRSAADARPVWAAVDEVTVGSAHPDIWLGQPTRLAVAPGRQFDHILTYGNRGGVTASDGQVTLQLPPGLIIVSADPPPASTTPALVWEVGDLGSRSASRGIRITLRVAASVANGAVLPLPASISSDSAEIEQANNTSSSFLKVGIPTYIPLINHHH